MNLNVTSTVRITDDFTVQQLREKRDADGNPAGHAWHSESYNPNLFDALHAVLRRGLVRGDDRVRVRGALVQLGRACRQVRDAAEGFITAKAATQIEGQVFGTLPESFWT